MSVIGWIRDLFGIQKDMYETKKTRLEIEKIEEERRGKLITLATFNDVIEYDPKYRILRALIYDKCKYGYEDGPVHLHRRRRRYKLNRLKLTALIITLLTLAFFFSLLGYNLFRGW